MAETQVYATGRRKTAVARVWLKPGTGKITINKREWSDYLTRVLDRRLVTQPLDLTGSTGTLDVRVNVRGGGPTGQAGAIRHGLSRALIVYNRDLREGLKKAGFLTRDARIKERKKYGLKSARARFQFSKR
jgi:small subunit ribosomal protein S9